MAGFYAAYHGAEGLKKIANRILRYRQTLVTALKWCGQEVYDCEGFDTIRVKVDKDFFDFFSEQFNATYIDGWLTLSIDELTTLSELNDIVRSLITFDSRTNTNEHVYKSEKNYEGFNIPQRKKSWLQQEVFHKYRSETNMMRYIYE